ncbi:MAG: hypothetical protein AAFR36_32610 [Bacteroidota bacterium]
MNIQPILQQRAEEIASGKNAATRNPIYVVYSLCDMYCSGHTEISILSNLKGRDSETGYLDREFEEPEFELTDEDMKEPMEVTRFWIDRFAAFFFTRKGAEDYMEYQRHNLTNPYIYVHSPGYANREAELIFN